MWQMSFLPIDLPSEEAQINLCYAFVESTCYYHQEISILNPAPTQYDPAYIFPRDMYLYYFHRDQSVDPLPLNELVDMVMKQHAPIHCVGSHRPDMDRTIQLIWMPPDGTAESQLIVQFIENLPSKEKQRIVDDLMQMCNETNTDSGIG